MFDKEVTSYIVSPEQPDKENTVFMSDKAKALQERRVKERWVKKGQEFYDRVKKEGGLSISTFRSYATPFKFMSGLSEEAKTKRARAFWEGYFMKARMVEKKWKRAHKISHGAKNK